MNEIEPTTLTDLTKNGVLCLFPGCAKKQNHRGLCYAHYATARRLVVAKKTTWEFLIAKGRASTCKKGGKRGGVVMAHFLAP